MKNIGKLRLNSEKVMNKDELSTLRGGTEVGTCYACWGEGGFIGHCYGTGLTPEEAIMVCNISYSPLITETVFQTQCP